MSGSSPQHLSSRQALSWRPVGCPGMFHISCGPQMLHSIDLSRALCRLLFFPLFWHRWSCLNACHKSANKLQNASFLWHLHTENVKLRDFWCPAGALHVICAARCDLPQLQRLPGPGPLQRPSPPGLLSAVPLSAAFHYVHLPTCTGLDFAVTYLHMCCASLIDTAAGYSIHVVQSSCPLQSSCLLQKLPLQTF